MSKNTFYLTTPLYYTNSAPHIGHAYSTIAADVLARFHRVSGMGRSHFLTGTDEHGQKIADAAAAQNKTPREFCDEIVGRWKQEWKQLDISYDQFIRTTDPQHEAAVQRIFVQLREQGWIKAGKYEGWYCRNDETFWVESRLIDGRCPNPECKRPVEWVSEDAWFFKLSEFRDRLIGHFQLHPDWVRPQSAHNEMMSVLQGGLEDLCVSRTSVDWGIPIPGGGGTIYVWFDAICNYISAAGFPHDMKRFESLWPADVHLIGKEILRFHTIIWPAILMALELPLPKLVFANGWITMQGQKMSKSLGNAMSADPLIARFSVDSLRYVLLAHAPFGTDFSFSEESMLRRHNADLANDLGNLVQRTLSMVARYRGGIIPAPTHGGVICKNFSRARADVDSAMAALDFRSALGSIWERVSALNVHVEQSKPWDLHKRGEATALDQVLYDLCESLRWLAALVYPFTPSTAQTISDALGEACGPDEAWGETLHWGRLKHGVATKLPSALFPRIEDVA